MAILKFNFYILIKNRLITITVIVFFKLLTFQINMLFNE